MKPHFNIRTKEAPCIGSFSHRCDIKPDFFKKETNLERGEFVSAHSLWIQAIMVQKSQQQEPEAAGPIHIRSREAGNDESGYTDGFLFCAIRDHRAVRPMFAMNFPVTTNLI